MYHRFLLTHALYEYAQTQPEAPAVRFSGQQLSYAQLAAQAAQVGRSLQEFGVQRGDRVGIFMNKNIFSAAAIYGILSAGAVEPGLMAALAGIYYALYYNSARGDNATGMELQVMKRPRMAHSTEYAPIRRSVTAPRCSQRSAQALRRPASSRRPRQE